MIALKYSCRCGTGDPADFYPSYRTRCKSCLKAQAAPKREAKLGYLKAWKERNPEAMREWTLANADHRRAYNAQRYASDRAGQRARYDRWREANPGKVIALIAKRTAAKLRQTPAWADLKAVEAIYIEAARLTRERGVQHDVDHIVPLQGRSVRGLHWEGNLQILPHLENLRKSNRLPEALS